MQEIISTHAPAGGATTPAQRAARLQRISTHAPAGGATASGRRSRPSASYFYSRPCGRGDSDTPRFLFRPPQFLLTPLREGRRCTPCCNRAAPFISTHAPAGGATICAIVVRDSLPDFYSRPCGRGDPNVVKAAWAIFGISTHAPAGGATLAAADASLIERIFLLTPLREGRHNNAGGRMKNK